MSLNAYFVPITDVESLISRYLDLGTKHGQKWVKRNKAAERMKKKRPVDCLIHWASRRVAITSPKVPVCQALKEKIISARERSSRRVAERFRAERFRDAVLYHPKLQN